MIDSEHYRPPVFRTKYPRQAVLHAPVKGIAAFEMKNRAFLWRVKVEILSLLNVIEISHYYLFLSFVVAALNPENRSAIEVAPASA